jgi:hypothetical protein
MADINAARYVPGNSTEANTQQRRPYANFGPMGVIDSGFNSNYNAVEIPPSVRFSARREAHGLCSSRLSYYSRPRRPCGARRFFADR